MPDEIVLPSKRLSLQLFSVLGIMLFPRLCPAADTIPTGYTNSIGMEFLRVSPGKFLMGSSEAEGGSSKERPRHTVHISIPFYLGKYEVTQGQWLAVMGKRHPSNFPSPDRPVDEVSWNDAQAFIQKLNEKEKNNYYRLPTEAEWEYAARAGSESAYCFGEDPEGMILGQYAWYEVNSGQQSHPVGTRQPNAWGFYDLHGNVAEWVQDFYDKSYYSGSPEKDPMGPTTGRKRVVRGGSWINQAFSCRSAARGYYSEDYTDSDFGFRIMRTAE